MPDDDPEVRRLAHVFIRRVGRKKARELTTGKPGRPRGSGIDDSAALRKMADLLYLGEVDSDRKASARLVPHCEGNSPKAIDRRLRRKFSKHRDALMGAAARRHAPPPPRSREPRKESLLPKNELEREIERMERHLGGYTVDDPMAEIVERLRRETRLMDEIRRQLDPSSGFLPDRDEN